MEFLLLHRAHHGPDYDGDWAWTPPSGARFPGETIDACARRELLEEVGLSVPVVASQGGPEDWQLFLAEVASDTDIVLGDAEHDRFEWVPLSLAMQRCKPERVAKGMEWIAHQIDA